MFSRCKLYLTKLFSLYPGSLYFDILHETQMLINYFICLSNLRTFVHAITSSWNILPTFITCQLLFILFGSALASESLL